MPDPTPTDPAADAAEQLVELVDADGRVLEVVSRAEMRRRPGVRHRCTYVVVVRPGGGVVVHQRAPWKDVAPSAWDIAFGGLCGVGEGWLDAATRELEEEAGLVGVPLVELGGGTWTDGHAALVGRAYLATTDAVLAPADGEVVAIEEVPWPELEAWMADREGHGGLVADSPAVVMPLLRRHLASHPVPHAVRRPGM
jgi:8-oxo-dGTP pyrophosphatase MutT (NUDIX family)